MWGFNHFYRATGYYWQHHHYWWFALGAVSFVYFAYRMGVIKSAIFHLIAFPLLLNRLFWLVDAYHLPTGDVDKRLPNDVFTAAGTLIVAIILYAAFAFSLSGKDR